MFRDPLQSETVLSTLKVGGKVLFGRFPFMVSVVVNFRMGRAQLSGHELESGADSCLLGSYEATVC